MSQLSASLNLSLAEYLNPDFDDHLPSFDQEPMSPAPPQSTSSTPPPAANHNVNHHVNNTNSSVGHASATAMASFGAPVPISTAHYGMPLSVSAFPPPPRRAEHSYAHYAPQQQQHQQQYPYNMANGPATLPPPATPSHALPKNRALQLPQSSSMLIQSPTIVPPVPSSAPDAPPSGSGPASGARKRPKYTRSKKGCLTCRSKKIKCDERKPMCTRCEHGHRECTWPEAVLPRRPKGAVRGVGNEEDMDDEDEERRQSMPGSAVSTHFPPSATSTSPTHYSGVGNNSPFEPAPRRDGYDASQFSMPSLPASGRHFYARGPGSADFQTITNVNSIDDYEFPPRQSFGTGSTTTTTLSRGYATTSGYLAGPPGVTPYNADVRRASWDSSAPTDGRRPSWDANSIAGAHTSSVSSPASSVLGLGVGVAGASGSRGATNAGHGSSGGLMLLQSPDPLSPFFRSVQERNLVGNISSTAISSSFLSSSSSSPFYNSSFASSSSSSLPIDVSKSFATTATHVTNTMSGYDFSNPAVSPVLSTASSSDILSRKNSFPHLYPPPRPLTIDPPLPMSTLGVDLSGPSVNLLSLAERSQSSAKTEEVQWIAPPSHMELFKPFASPEEVEYGSLDAYS